MNNALKVVTTKKEFNVPTITNTTPVQQGEIDLTFVQFAQRKRNALDYIASVERREAAKAAKKKNLMSSIKSAVCNILCGISLAAGFFGVILVGMIF